MISVTHHQKLETQNSGPFSFLEMISMSKFKGNFWDSTVINSVPEGVIDLAQIYIG
jgi:hypothetical protein